MAVELAVKYLGHVDELFAAESKISLITNDDWDWTGAQSVRIYKVSTAPMYDYDRKGEGESPSRYGQVQGLDATTEQFTLSRDRSFTFATDLLDEDETVGALQASAALARQLRLVTVPEVDSYTYNVMCQNAGTRPAPLKLMPENIYDEILKANKILDDALVPEAGRFLILTPDTYMLLKKSPDVVMNTEIGSDMRLRGVVSNLDGNTVIKVPAVRLPDKFGFLLVHPSATAAPVKLASFKIHRDPPGISGSLIEGRICYDAFCPDNKRVALYYQALV